MTSPNRSLLSIRPHFAGTLLIAACWIAFLSGCAIAQPQNGSGEVVLSSPIQPAIPGLENFGAVEPKVLYRGAAPAVDPQRDLDGYRSLVRDYKIKTIVDLTNDPVDRWLARRKRDCEKMTPTERALINYVRLPSYEPFPKRQTLVTLLRIVRDPNNRPVFVHCADGENRTGALMAGYRVVEEGWRPVDAKAEMTNFHVFKIWKGVNDRFVDDVARDREAIRGEVAAETANTSLAPCGD